MGIFEERFLVEWEGPIPKNKGLTSALIVKKLIVVLDYNFLKMRTMEKVRGF